MLLSDIGICDRQLAQGLHMKSNLKLHDQLPSRLQMDTPVICSIINLVVKFIKHIACHIIFKRMTCNKSRPTGNKNNGNKDNRNGG